MRHGLYVAILAALLGVLWAALAIAPVSRHDWALENALLRRLRRGARRDLDSGFRCRASRTR